MHRPFFAATFVSLATVLVSGHPAQAFAAPQGTPATQAAATGLTAEQINNRIDEVFNELEKLNERMAKEAGASADGAARLERASQEVAMKAIKGVNLASLDATAFAASMTSVVPSRSGSTPRHSQTAPSSPPRWDLRRRCSPPSTPAAAEPPPPMP